MEGGYLKQFFFEMMHNGEQPILFSSGLPRFKDIVWMASILVFSGQTPLDAEVDPELSGDRVEQYVVLVYFRLLLVCISKSFAISKDLPLFENQFEEKQIGNFAALLQYPNVKQMVDIAKGFQYSVVKL